MSPAPPESASARSAPCSLKKNKPGLDEVYEPSANLFLGNLLVVAECVIGLGKDKVGDQYEFAGSMRIVEPLSGDPNSFSGSPTRRRTMT